MDQEDKQFWFVLAMVVCALIAGLATVINYVNQLNQ